MINHGKEQEIPRTYTQKDVSRIIRDFTRHDVKPPDELIVRYVPDYSLELKSWNQIKIINMRNGELRRAQESTVFESPKPMERIRRTFATAGMIFAAGLNR